ncbi:hypothetical protein EVAR_21439_1 [Eumeta japonica]|uniref:Uncharacterized protein n=1 Tax=Eumeta variegata TaxID=151549 RepID=A0A4C1VJ15_EUMVA|nr:hypothetical protein EVAR_21439_1 [Eumeta japonica]
MYCIKLYVIGVDIEYEPPTAPLTLRAGVPPVAFAITQSLISGLRFRRQRLPPKRGISHPNGRAAFGHVRRFATPGPAATDRPHPATYSSTDDIKSESDKTAKDFIFQ